MAKIQLENGEYVLETMEQIKARADELGLDVVFPGPTEVQIDIDSEEAYTEFHRRWDIASEHLKSFKMKRNEPSRSGLPKRHITLDTGIVLSEGQRIALQCALGSDSTRELLNITEHLLGMEHPTLFYERKGVLPEMYHDTLNDIFYASRYRMVSGITIQRSVKYRKFECRKSSGRLWLVGDVENAAEYVYCGYSHDTKSEGFAGRWMTFETVDGEQVKLQGPWHSDSESLYACTGYDVRNKVLTYVVVAKERCCSGGQDYFKGILYIDDAPTLGEHGRYKDIAQKIADQVGERVMYYTQSSGGSSSGPVDPTEKFEFEPAPNTQQAAGA